MKVILKGIRQGSETSNSEKKFIDLLKQVPYPIVIEVKDDDPFANLKAYISDEDHPNSKEEWGLTWFDYEKIEE